MTLHLPCHPPSPHNQGARAALQFLAAGTGSGFVTATLKHHATSYLLTGSRESLCFSLRLRTQEHVTGLQRHHGRMEQVLRDGYREQCEATLVRLVLETETL